jgi:hypothetical protein
MEADIKKSVSYVPSTSERFLTENVTEKLEMVRFVVTLPKFPSLITEYSLTYFTMVKSIEF